jgi:hypothetical protein
MTTRERAHEWDMFSDPDDWSALVLMLGGSDDSWTGEFLKLVQKSDPAHLYALRRAAPGYVAAWRAWQASADGSGAGVIAAHAAYLAHRTQGNL